MWCINLNNSCPLKIKVLNTHLPSNVLIIHTPQINRLSLTRQVRDNIIINRRADKEVLREASHNQKRIM
jgi:hypothetical protein